MNLTDKIAQFCASIKYNDLTPEVVEKAKVAMIDTYGVIHTGFKEPLSDILAEWVKKMSCAGESTVLGYGFKTSAGLAGLLNGAMGHAIDYDDVHSPLRGHPSVVVLPAVLAVAEAEGKSGRDLITAFVIGVEVMTKLGGYVNPSHYYKGWHSTATLGVIGAAVAAGVLYEFDEEQMKTVLGLSCTMVSGMRLNFGTMTKPYHAGFAARNGIEAAQLVRRGFTASKTIFDQPMNFFEMYSAEKPSNRWGDDLGNPWSIAEPGFNIKRYPCCYATHRMADAAYQIATANRIDISTIESVACRVPTGGLAPLIHHRPKKGLEAKFSMEYVVSAMLADKALNFKTFTDEMVGRQHIQDLIPKVSLHEDASIKEDRLNGNLGYVTLTVKTKDRVYEETVYHAKGSSKNPLTLDELKQKFFDCFALVNQRDQADKRFHSLINLQDLQDVKILF